MPYLLPVYSLTNSESQSISAANIPAVLREVENNEGEQRTEENIELLLCNSCLMQMETGSERRGAPSSVKPTLADWLTSASVIKS